MAGLSLIVFPVLGVIGVAMHLSTPSDMRTDKANTFLKRYVLGVGLTWLGFEITGQVDPILATIVTLSGIYLCLFNGIWLFTEDPKSIDSNITTASHNTKNIEFVTATTVSKKEVPTSSADQIISTQRKLYDDGIWTKEATSLNSINSNAIRASGISGEGWKYDKNQRILWNVSTNEILHGSSGLGFSVTDEYFILYNKLEPRKILIREVAMAEYGL